MTALASALHNPSSMTRVRLLLSCLLAVSAIALFASASHARPSGASGVSGFVKAVKPTRASQHYAFGRFRVPRLVAKGMQKLGLGSQLRSRTLLQVTNASLQQFTKATSKGYLEVVVPANKGHVYFRHGGKVFDFYPGGLRVGGVRPIRSDRYGMLVKLTPKQEKRLARYFGRLEQTNGAELGKYDFHGDKGFHCVTWLMRAALGDKGGDNLVKLLGGRAKHGRSMPRFARFMLKQAAGRGAANQKGYGVEAVAIYKADSLSSTQLGKLNLQLMSSRQLRRAHTDTYR
jgi:hypothetical protein